MPAIPGPINTALKPISDPMAPPTIDGRQQLANPNINAAGVMPPSPAPVAKAPVQATPQGIQTAWLNNLLAQKQSSKFLQTSVESDWEAPGVRAVKQAKIDRTGPATLGNIQIFDGIPEVNELLDPTIVPPGAQQAAQNLPKAQQAMKNFQQMAPGGVLNPFPQKLKLPKINNKKKP